MNDPTPILGQGDASRGSVAVATARRSACVLAFVLLFLTLGSVPGNETGAHGFAIQATSKPARADTLSGQELVDVYQADLLSTRTRHKTH